MGGAPTPKWDPMGFDPSQICPPHEGIDITQRSHQRRKEPLGMSRAAKRAKGLLAKVANAMDTVDGKKSCTSLKLQEAIACWYLQGNHHAKHLRWCRISSIHSRDD